MPERIALALFFGACGLGACGGGAGDAPDAAPAADATPGDPSVLAGSFRVDLIAAAGAQPAFTSVTGEVHDGATPALFVWEEAQAEGDCRLSTPRVPFCQAPCGGGAVCVEDDVCQPYPSRVGAGDVHVSGLRTTGGDSEVDLRAVNDTYSLPAGVTLEYPPAAEGASVTLTAAGDAVPGFTLVARGVAPLELAATALVLDRDQPFALAWTPAGTASASTVHVKIDISHHGGTKGMIECDTADDGALELSAGLATALLDLGVAGYPTVIVTRGSTGTGVIPPGRVELVVSSQVEREIEIPGVISCNDPGDCPAGTTCQPDLTCR